MIDSPLLGLLLLAALVAVPLVLRRVRAAAPNGLRVTGRTALHKSAVVAVVAVGERRLLLGAGDRGVQLLTELDPAVSDGASPSGSAPASGPATVAVADEHAVAGPGTHDLDPHTAGRTDAGRHPLSTDPATPQALDALLGPPGSSSPVRGASAITGPGNGLVDRLRAMTVRTAPQHSRPGGGLRALRAARVHAGRPTRDPIRR